MKNPVKKEKQTGRKKVVNKGKKDTGPENYLFDQLLTKKANYRVFEYGNYPLVDGSAGKAGLDKEMRPRNGHWMMKLPPDADWTHMDQDEEQKLKDYRMNKKKERNLEIESQGLPRI